MPLYPFQIEAVKKMAGFLDSNHGVYNACEQGLGKCLQTIECTKSFGFKRYLLVCPKSVKGVWEEELKKWGALGAWEIHSYNMIAKLAKKLSIHNYYQCLILDEAHYVKNHKALRSKAILRYLWDKIPYKIALSGTPFTQSVMDCWTLFSRFAPEAFPDYWQFAYRYTNIEDTPWGQKFVGINNASELKEIINSKFFFRYIKKDVLKDLPEKTFQKIPIPASYAVKLSDDEQLAHERWVKLLTQSIATGDSPPPAPKNFASFRHDQGIKKLPFIKEFIKDFIDQGIPLVVFGYHKAFLSELSEYFKASKPSVITGATKELDRVVAVKRFQEGATDLFLGQYTAAGTGLTLTRASHCICGELDPSPSTIAQAIDRLHRIGQKDAVTVYLPTVEGSIEEKLLNIVYDKSRTFNEILS